jgi:hypothetical protein
VERTHQQFTINFHYLQAVLDQSVSSVASTAKFVASGLLDDQRAELTQLREEIQEKIQQEVILFNIFLCDPFSICTWNLAPVV